MNRSEYTSLLEHPEQISAQQIADLKSIVEQYPYFQSARALYLKGLKNSDSFKYNNALKRTAAYTADRSVLFDYITSKVFNQNAISQNIKQNTEYLKKLELTEVDDISVNKSVLIDDALKNYIQNTEGVLDPELFERKEPEEQPNKATDPDQGILDIDVKNITAEEQLDLGKPLEFDEHETHSFAEWLKITNFKPIIRKEEEHSTSAEARDTKDRPLSSKLDLIDKFISENPKIVPADNQPPAPRPSDASWKDEGLMTETLARIYLEQKNYDKAIQSYKILSLKYPEKSSFFANQIKAVEELQSHNT
jgi:hypothetical protein